MVKVCVVGCGGAGLAAARCLSERVPDFDFTVFEQTPYLGGTWVYTDTVGKEENGLPVHTSMYKNLRTNLPKEIMGYPDFPIPKQERSFISSEEILNYLNTYCDKFDLRKYIKFNHHVKCVTPISENRWQVSVLDLIKQVEVTEIFDAVMICNGHYNTPSYPELKGISSFDGEQMHSHDYREPSCFKGKKVIVVGAGPSGVDLSLEASKVASQVILSGRDDNLIKNTFPAVIEMRPEIASIEGSNIIFKDGSSVQGDMLFYCTGYKYYFPFLNEECGIRVENNRVHPLFKHLIHIEKPTMCFIGLPCYVCAFSLFHLQVKFFLKTLTGEISLPSKDDMKRDVKCEEEMRKKMGIKENKFHTMGSLQGDYYNGLSTFGNLPIIPPVMAKIHNDSSESQIEDAINFRNNKYKILDSENFIKFK
ncbi:hypothetical protein AAG570_012283 [Ranatra chinensis]|uniref:Flavin-containing monooxygenase n=1 Tax=Ranatra chinensis TaxID=642074 RepID=A0ABD0YIM6_9HEMI